MSPSLRKAGRALDRWGRSVRQLQEHIVGQSVRTTRRERRSATAGRARVGLTLSEGDVDREVFSPVPACLCPCVRLDR